MIFKSQIRISRKIIKIQRKLEHLILRNKSSVGTRCPSATLMVTTFGSWNQPISTEVEVFMYSEILTLWIRWSSSTAKVKKLTILKRKLMSPWIQMRGSWAAVTRFQRKITHPRKKIKSSSTLLSFRSTSRDLYLSVSESSILGFGCAWPKIKIYTFSQKATWEPVARNSALICKTSMMLLYIWPIMQFRKTQNHMDSSRMEINYRSRNFRTTLTKSTQIPI